MHVFNDELAKLCGSGAEHSDPILGEKLEAPLGIEAPVVEQDSGAAAPRAEQDAGAGLAPVGICRTPHEVGRGQRRPVHCHHSPCEQRPAGMGDALGFPR